jgi:putative addiction module component (TIGR02574 family)
MRLRPRAAEPAHQSWAIGRDAIQFERCFRYPAGVDRDWHRVVGARPHVGSAARIAVVRGSRTASVDNGAAAILSRSGPLRPKCRDLFRRSAECSQAVVLRWTPELSRNLWPRGRTARVPPRKAGPWRRSVARVLASQSGIPLRPCQNPPFPPQSGALAIRGYRGTIESMDAKRVIDEALRLPVDIRAALAGELLASLDDSELEPDREAAWSTEIRDRIDAYERGDVTAVPADQALAQIRAVRGKAT